MALFDNFDPTMMGLSILANNQGPNFMQNLGTAGAQYMQYQQALAEAQKQKEYEDYQLEQMRQKNERENLLFKQRQKQYEADMGITGGISPELFRHQNPSYKAADIPASLREMQAYKGMSEEDKNIFSNVIKRGPTVMDMGGFRGVYDAPKREFSARFDKTLKPEDEPEYKKEAKKAELKGKSAAETESELSDRIASLPRLEEVVNELSNLGKKATYTKVGQFRDTARRELGFDVGEGAVARKEYISKVDNEILPLLRQTFGAAFTQKEGESLKATLGDPDASPEEKDAVLRSFIDNKVAQIGVLKSKVGIDDEVKVIELPNSVNPMTLKKGSIYSTPKGNLLWNGKEFEDL